MAIPEQVDEVMLTCDCCLQPRTLRKGQRVVCIDRAAGFQYWQKLATIVRLERWPNGETTAVYRWHRARHLESMGAMWFAPANDEVQRCKSRAFRASEA